MISKLSSIFYAVLVCVAFISCNGGKENELADQNNVSVDTLSEKVKELNGRILKDPNNPDLYKERADYYLRNKDVDAALADITRALKIDSTKSAYYLTLSDIYFSANKTKDSKLALEKCIFIDSKNVAAMMKLAELYLYVKKNQESINYINMALKVDRYNAKAYFMKGMNFKEIKDTVNTISSMMTAVEQDQQYYDAYIQLGILHAAKKNKLAVDYYDNALRIRPNSTEALYDKAKYYQDVKDFDNASMVYQMLLKTDSTYKNAYFNLGVIHLINDKKYDEAIHYFNRAVRFDDKYVEAYYALGSCYQAKGDSKKATENYGIALQLNPDYMPAIEAMNSIQVKR